VRAFLVLGCLAVLGWFVGLGRIGWIDEREARDAAIARELLQRRELLTPLLGGVPRFEKPLLAYGPEAAAAVLDRESPRGARATKATLAAVLVALTGVLGARRFGRRAGLLGAAVLATSLALPIAVRTDGTQLLASLLGWLGWAGLSGAARGGGTSRGLTAGYLALAAALVIAGPLPALWPLLAVALVGPAERRAVHARVGSLVLLGAGLPWYGAMLERHGAAFAWALPSFPYGGDAGAPWYTTPARVLGFLVVGFFPWSTALPAAVLVRFAGATGAAPALAETRRMMAALLAALVPMLFAAAAPLPAVLPALPAAALLVGALLDRTFAGEGLARRAVAQATWLVAGSGTVAAWMLEMVSRRLGEGAPELRLVAAFLLVAAWAPALATFIGRTGAAPALLACVLALGTPLVALRTLPALEGYLTCAPIGSTMNEVSNPSAPLLLVEPPAASLRVTLARHLTVRRDLPRALREFRDAAGWAYVAYPPRRESEVARAASPAPLEILTRTPLLVLARVGGR
jgi:4-amino-4-deoxy-L-arabinose transferase-like glycosyltransferase